MGYRAGLSAVPGGGEAAQSIERKLRAQVLKRRGTMKHICVKHFVLRVNPQHAALLHPKRHPMSLGVTERPHGDKAGFSLTDSGIGIAPGDQLHILERFHEADKARIYDLPSFQNQFILDLWK